MKLVNYPTYDDSIFEPTRKQYQSMMVLTYPERNHYLIIQKSSQTLCAIMDETTSPSKFSID